MSTPTRLLGEVFELIQNPTAGAVVLLIVMTALLSPYAFLAWVISEYSPGFFSRIERVEDSLSVMVKQQERIVVLLENQRHAN